MKAVVTGFDSRACRSSTGKKHLSFGYLITELLISHGFTVHQHECWPEDPECRQHLKSADFIFVGISSPVSLTSHYALTAMAVLSEFSDDHRLRLFVDDPNIAKIRYGSASAYRRWSEEDKDPLFANYSLRRRPHFDDAVNAKDRFYEVCRMLRSWKDIAPTFAPISQTFGDFGLSAKKEGLIPLDLTLTASNVVESYFYSRPKTRTFPVKSQSWYVEPWVTGGSKWANGVQTTHDKVSFPSPGWENKLETILSHYGVLESPKSKHVNGWWSAVPILASESKQFYATSMSDVRVLQNPESAYYLLPYVFEEMSVAEQQNVVKQQTEELFDVSPSIELSFDVLTAPTANEGKP